MDSMAGSILLLTSDSQDGLQEEGIPVIAMEAMRAGMVVVATQNGGISELIDDNKTGFLVPQQDVPAISVTLKKVINMDTEKKNELIINARSKVVEKFNAKTNAEEFFTLIINASVEWIDTTNHLYLHLGTYNFSGAL